MEGSGNREFRKMDPGIESAMVDLPPYGFAAKDFFKLDASGAKSDHGMHFARGGTPFDPLPLVRGGGPRVNLFSALVWGMLQ